MIEPTTRRAYRSALRRRAVTRALIGGVVATGIAVVLAVTGSGATLAVLSSQTLAVPATGVTAGSASISVSAPSAFTRLAPGVSQGRTFTVTNTGDAPLDLTVDSSSFGGTLASSATVGIRSGSTVCDGTSGNAVWTRTPASAPTGTIGVTLAPRAATTLCLAVTVSGDAPASAEGASMSASITLGGKQR